MRLGIQSLASLSGLRNQRCLELWHRSQTWWLLWLWRRPAAVTLICPLAWKPPLAASAAIKRKEKKKRSKKIFLALISNGIWFQIGKLCVSLFLFSFPSSLPLFITPFSFLPLLSFPSFFLSTLPPFLPLPFLL